MTRIVNRILQVAYPYLVMGGAVLAWDYSGHAESPQINSANLLIQAPHSLMGSCQAELKNPFQKGCSIASKNQNYTQNLKGENHVN